MLPGEGPADPEHYLALKQRDGKPCVRSLVTLDAGSQSDSPDQSASHVCPADRSVLPPAAGPGYTAPPRLLAHRAPLGNTSVMFPTVRYRPDECWQVAGECGRGETRRHAFAVWPGHGSISGPRQSIAGGAKGGIARASGLLKMSPMAHRNYPEGT